ncbi:TetR/AcrR family transcriptional regulator C-terminal domain-containing protein [Streptomyces sp. CRN 30]|uniref:TetR/AcrR family transcriptional regulator C-terminal domain-containing protein n=1 Tax=Streptomyces sp. CRN 30 TaxID=3075613 RepID=UPI002A7FD18A|nr:TetR/AcrR family transcriptional regulator C-terminal domain-containing protein [Streptomyces sp. CRN 30]
MPRPRSLSHAGLAAAALAVIDRDGLAGLSMRTVAKELGMSTMALYRYVRDRAELELLVVDLVLGRVDSTPPPTELSCRERIEVMVRRLRDTVGAHPEIVPLTVVHRHRSTAGLRWTETVLGLLAEAGVEGHRRVVALRGLIGYITGAIQLEHLGPLAGAGTVALAELPPEEFPHLRQTARHAREVGADREFLGGLALLLRGLGL